MIKGFVLFVALFVTLLWVNMLVTESINARINPYASSKGEDEKQGKLKLWFILFMSIFWTVFINMV